MALDELCGEKVTLALTPGSLRSFQFADVFLAKPAGLFGLANRLSKASEKTC